MENFESSLIEQVKQYPLLYDKASPDFKNSVRKEKAWQIIAFELSIDGERAKTRWRSLRDRFVRERRKVDQLARSGSAAVEDPQWSFYEELKFLKAHTETRATSSNYTPSQPINEEVEEIAHRANQLAKR
ncbi:transcription factor Adf-1-like [Topomyia yanbarensis]|uniref:transcription factor Adf-1-like n=1 Tax=Topomyia yanbarensis TaxID=2498891 RepID=UPI00273AAEB3|nr:transcription factor Adf-1-like [Topomyia yanbarensis]XP_058814063.1 transcription factor Adf-1-like [Topomyia yanbarensis]